MAAARQLIAMSVDFQRFFPLLFVAEFPFSLWPDLAAKLKRIGGLGLCAPSPAAFAFAFESISMVAESSVESKSLFVV